MRRDDVAAIRRPETLPVTSLVMFGSPARESFFSFPTRGGVASLSVCCRWQFMVDQRNGH